MNPSLHLSFAFAALLLAAPEAGAQQPPAPMPAPGAVPGAPAIPAPNPAATFVPGRMIGMRPSEKRPLMLKENERNPYAKRSVEEVEAAEEQANSEELRIREKLGTLKVTGSSQGRNGLRVLMGDIILEEGRDLPQLLEDQSELIRVMELTEDIIVLGWLDSNTGQPTGKTAQVAYDLSPSVGYALQGQNRGNGEESVAARRMGVLRVGQDRKKQEAGMAARANQNEIPPEVFQAGQ